ncbi:MAG: glucose 1-dehydrogenase [Pseudomonadota bacterium]
MGRLDGKVAIITGGAQGMGEATARLFASEGANVAMGDVKADEGEAVAKEIGDAAHFQKLDVTSEDDWASLVTAVNEKWGRIDILVNNAGVVHFTDIEDFDPVDAQRVIGVNTIGPVLGAKHVAPTMKSQGNGAIINISSVDGLRGCNGLTVYTASKWALRGLTKSLAFELGPAGVRVNSIHPGGVDTPMGNSRNLPPDELHFAFKRVPLQRIGKPEEIAQASLFIASDEASYITGAEIAVDGGWHAGYYMPVLPGAPEGLDF